MQFFDTILKIKMGLLCFENNAALSADSGGMRWGGKSKAVAYHPKK
jgi:hypothetical protein